MKPALSIVIPALNEAASIEATLRALQPLRARGVELVLADGGSGDTSVAVSRPWVDAVVDAPRGGALQMNAGAAQARADALLFLHADPGCSPWAMCWSRRRWPMALSGAASTCASRAGRGCCASSQQ